MIKPYKITDMNALIQSPSLGYLKQCKAWGSKFNFVKTSEGTTWPNTKYGINCINEMIHNSLKVWGNLGVYHFWHGENADIFLRWSKYHKLNPSTTKFMLDVEDTSTRYNIMARINQFFKQLIDFGYKKGNLFLYVPLSWIREGFIIPRELKYGFIWVAMYPYTNVYRDNKTTAHDSSNPGYNIWQFSGLGNQDWSWVYNNCIFYDIDSKSKAKPKHHIIKHAAKKPINHYLTKGDLFEALSNNYGYRDPEFKIKNGNILAKGSRIHGKVLKFGHITRLDTPIGWFSTNTKYLKAVK